MNDEIMKYSNVIFKIFIFIIHKIAIKNNIATLDAIKSIYQNTLEKLIIKLG